MLIVTAAIVIWAYRRNTMLRFERRLIAISCACLIAMLLWVPAVAPAAFLRYPILVAPLGSLLTAWVLIQFGRLTGPSLAWISAAIFLLTPWLSLPLHVLRPHTLLHATVIRPDLKLLPKAVFGHPPDPNRPVIQWLKANAAPSDESLINYVDSPLMFYLPKPIRGGIAAFRAEDDTRKPPDFMVLRRSVNFVHWPVFEHEVRHYTWRSVNLQAPDIICGSCPDPVERYDASRAAPIFVARRVGEPETARR